jgi:hypothetical protein
MYTLQATVYEDPRYCRCYAYLWVGEGKTDQPMATAHVALPQPIASSSPDHALIFAAISQVCHELAENYEESLF